MADLSVNVGGIELLRAEIERNLAGQRQRLAQQLNQLGSQMTAEIRAAAPRKTGALAASVRYELVVRPNGPGLVIHVGNKTAFYAAHVEYGHWSNPGKAVGGKNARIRARSAQGARFVPAHPFVRPVVAKYQKQVSAQIEQSIQETWAA